MKEINQKSVMSELEGILSAFGYSPDLMSLEVSSHIYKQNRQKEIEAFISNDQLHEKIIKNYHSNYEFLKKKLHNLVISPVKNECLEDVEETNLPSTDYDEKEFGIYYEAQEKMARVCGQKTSELSAEVEEMNIHTEEVEKVREVEVMSGQAYKTMGEVKAIVTEIIEYHYEIFRIDLAHFFMEYLEKNPIVIVMCLMNNRARDLIMNHQGNQTSLSKAWQTDDFFYALSPYTKMYRGDTEGIWNPIGEDGKKYLVLKISGGALKGTEQSKLTTELSSSDVNGKYPLLDGLTFNSHLMHESVIYLEG